LAINDTFGTPTYAPDLARQLHRLAQLDLPGTYHIVNAGEGCTFEGFARSAFEIANLDSSLLEGVSRDALKRPAPRPRNSRLRCLLSEAIGLDPLRSWKDGLRDFASAGSPARVANAEPGRS